VNHDLSTLDTLRNDEIDLIELASNLWKEKFTIILVTLLAGALGLSYVLTTAPTFKASAQLLPPIESELSSLNKTAFFNIDSERAFKYFLGTLENNDHIFDLANNSATAQENSDPIATINKTRLIQYPNTSKKKNNITPDLYTLTHQGTDKKNITMLLAYDLDTATKKTTEIIKNQYITSLQKEINIIKNKQETEKNHLLKQLKSRQRYIELSRNNEINHLEKSLAIAKKLDIKEPTSLSKLAGDKNNHSNNTSDQTSSDREEHNTFNQYKSHLKSRDYLNGQRLLQAEINSLKAIELDDIFDNDINIIKSKLNLLDINPTLRYLKELKKQDIDLDEISFFSKNIYTPSKPIKPKKALILIISVLLGGMIGLFIAIGRIIYKGQRS